MKISTLKPDTGTNTDSERDEITILSEKGFHSFSFDELVEIASEREGSSHYRPENEDAAVHEMRRYVQYVSTRMDHRLIDRSLTPIERIRVFAADVTEDVVNSGFKRGCLIGSPGQQLAAHEEVFRIGLLAVIRNWRSRMQACLDEAKAAGQIKPEADTEALARYFWNTWEGAVLCSKLEKSRVPLDDACSAFIEYLKCSGDTRISAS